MDKEDRKKKRKALQKTSDCTNKRKKSRIQIQNDRCMTRILPYDLSTLDWDDEHRVNRQNCYCYCGQPGEWIRDMMQCHECQQWFHRGCIECRTDSLVFGDLMYVFFCSSCFNEEYYIRLRVSWSDLAYLALLNLEKKNEKCFDLESDILPWINSNWRRLKSGKKFLGSKDRLKELNEALKDDEIRFVKREGRSRTPRWGLQQSVPLRPSYVDFSELSSPPPPMHRATLLRNHDDHSHTVHAKNAKKRDLVVKKSSSVLCKTPLVQPTKHKQCKSSRKNSSGSVSHTDSSSHPLVFSFDPSIQTASTSGILDRLIPILEDYNGVDHPFKTDRDRQIEMASAHRRAAAMSLCARKTDKDDSIRPSVARPSVAKKKDLVSKHSQSTSNLLNFSGVDITNHPKTSGKNRRKTMQDALQDEDDVTLAHVKVQLHTDFASEFGKWGKPTARRFCNDDNVQYLIEWNEQIVVPR